MSMQKFIEIQKKELEKAKTATGSDLEAILNKQMEALDLLVRNYSSPEYTESEADEMALVCQVLEHNEIPYGSVWATHDIQFEIAKAFLKAYPLGAQEWGVDFEFEETVYAFGKQYCKEKEIRII